MRQKGLSYGEINKIIGVPKSTLSGWLSDVKLSSEVADRMRDKINKDAIDRLIRRNKMQTVDARKRAQYERDRAKHEINNLTINDLSIIGIILYWAEGYKRLKIKNGREITSHVISLTNSDPDIIHTFILFLKNILLVKDCEIKIEMRLFKHINAREAISYWMDVTGLSESQFNKPMYPLSDASKGKRPKNRLPYGTVQVIVSNTKLFHYLLGMIEGIKDKLKEMINVLPR